MSIGNRTAANDDCWRPVENLSKFFRHLRPDNEKADLNLRESIQRPYLGYSPRKAGLQEIRKREKRWGKFKYENADDQNQEDQSRDSRPRWTAQRIKRQKASMQ